VPGRLPRGGFRSPRSPRRSWMKPTRAALYARCSTGHQDVCLQVDELRAVARPRGGEVVGVFAERGISGTEQSRPALYAIVADCKAVKVDVVVVLDVNGPPREAPKRQRGRQQSPSAARLIRPRWSAGAQPADGGA
jgi:hypothetical protein